MKSTREVKNNESFVVPYCFTRRVLGNNRTTTKHNITISLRSTFDIVEPLLTPGFAQMDFRSGLAIRTMLRAALTFSAILSYRLRQLASAVLIARCGSGFRGA